MKYCTAEECQNVLYCKGMCKKHYMRVRRTGSYKVYQKEGYVKLGGPRDEGKGRRGSLAVNWINDIKFKAIKRGKKWNLDHEQAFKLITSECKYCGYKPDWPKERIGIDRIYNQDQYTPENSVPCCFTCNSAKGTKTLQEFKDWIRLVYSKL